MSSEAAYRYDPDIIKKRAVGAVVSGQMVQLPGGRAGYCNTLKPQLPGDLISWQVEGVIEIAKTAGIVFLDGGDVFWDVSANKAHFRPEAGTPDFKCGTAVGDATSSATTMLIKLNGVGVYGIDLQQGSSDWAPEETLGLGVIALPGGGFKLAFDAVAEVAQAAVVSVHSVPLSAGPILEARVAIYDIGDDASLDIDIGIATGSHASDFEALANFAAIHFDGNALDIKVHSDDGTTDVAAADSTIDAVDNTYFEVWIDCRNLADVQIYVNGVDAVPGGTTLVLTAAAANALKAVAMIEKTSNDTTADVRLSRLRVRTAGEGV